MKEYKVVTAKNPEEAEQQMNIYAAEAAFLDGAARAALIEKLKPYL